MKKFLFIVFLSLCCFASFAAHTKGGWISYQYLGPGNGPNMARYKVTVYVYMIPGAMLGQQLDAQISLTIFSKPGNAIFQNSDVAPLVAQPHNKNCQNCNPCISNAPNIEYKYATYETTIELPVSTHGYTIAYQRCCRVGGIVNIVGSGSVGDTWAIDIPGTVNSSNAPMNSSPQFIANDTAVICASNYFEFDFTATDPDGDSLVYEFAPAYVGGGNSGANIAPNPAGPPPYATVPYAAGFSELNPVGPGVTINPATGVVSGIAPGNFGEYVLTAVVKEYRNGVYIGESRKSLHINVASCGLVAAEPVCSSCTAVVAPAITYFTSCNSFTTTFTNINNSPLINSYFWDFGVTSQTSDTSTVPVPTFTYPDTGVYKLTLIINRGQGCYDSTTTEVRIYPGFFPAFTSTGECKNTKIQFTDRSTTNYGVVNTWSWDFGDTGPGNTSTLRNPTHTYTTAGTYTVTLNVTSNKGCSDKITQTLIIKNQPDLSVTNDTLICSIDTLQLNAVGTGTVSWTPNYNINNQNSAVPLVSPDIPTKYYVTLTDASGCEARDSVFVDVKLFVTIDAGKDTGICAGDAIKLNPISDALHYNWTPSAPLDNAAIKNPVAAPTATTKFYVIGNIGKCQSTDSITIRVAPYPGAAGIPDTAICFGSNLQLNASGGSMYSWSPPFFLNDPNIPNPIASPDKSIKYVVTITDTLGCPKPAFDTVVVQVQRPVADAGPRDTSIVENQPLQLNATGGQFYLWSPATGLNNPAIANPVALINTEIDYVVSVSTSAGCFATDTISVKVYKVVPGIYVPNGFTPNGDGVNDVFRPIAIGMKQINYFKVYNRWGVLVYSSERTAYDANVGWDGKYRGTPQSSAVYAWIVEGVDYLDKKITQKGTVTLIR